MGMGGKESLCPGAYGPGYHRLAHIEELLANSDSASLMS